MDTQLKDQGQQTIKYETFTGIDSWGDSSYSTQKTATVRIFGRRQLVANGDAQQVVSEKQFVGETQVLERALVWLPEDSTSDPGWLVLASGTRVDENGAVDYYKSWLGRRAGRGSE